MKLDLLKCLLTARELDDQACVPLASVKSGGEKRKPLKEDATAAQREAAEAADRKLEGCEKGEVTREGGRRRETS